MRNRPERRLETPVETMARLQAEVQDLRSTLQGQRHRQRWLYFYDPFDSVRRGGIYYNSETLFIRRELINPEAGFPGQVQGGEVIFIPGLIAVRYIDEATGTLLGEIYFNAEGEAKIVGRAPSDGHEYGALEFNDQGNAFLTADNDFNIDADAVFLKAGSGSDTAELHLYANGETKMIANGDDLGGFKTFVIDHPDEPEDRYLVHACIEGPTADLIYRGEAEIVDGRAVVELPRYFESAAHVDGRQVQLTPIDELCMVAASRIEEGRFTIRCSGPDGTRVAWLVTAIRADVAPFDVEPRKAEVVLRGGGPYRYLVRSSGAEPAGAKATTTGEDAR